ncbi:glycosyl hydrolase 115 family protein [Pelagicoccus sp. SDUM812002]|uniref:glycosyl hydrolase 115 family protein n=1 Tax=Pelagicoccus sp. SDUM812002 TaxID=3041266 RepID=UPI00280D2EC2|nr:glycosyl hydrolase 115 family protein [Pelagicoccus sp. SDUM812002]MDQ8184007.1 glycosyl hydrolase 115 family protein [Pelagicoccus sp. SDUM812002]
MKLLYLSFLLMPALALAQFRLVPEDSLPGVGFELLGGDALASIHFDATDAVLVDRVANLLAEDIERVTGRLPKVESDLKSVSENCILIGSLGQNRWIDELADSGRIDAEAIRGSWERYLVEVVQNPFPGVEKALVVAGSDRRGTAYGALSLSETIGVSPWYYWADVPVAKQDTLSLEVDSFLSPPPTIKYRGIFLNDEDWGLFPWSAETFDPELGDIGPKTYEKVFELLLRLKGNMVAPAMHACTQAFFTVPGNMKMADDYGVMITTAHCEPLLYNNASEWNVDTQGEWNYMVNRDEITRVLDERVAEAAAKENIYTIALRGMHDEGMLGVEEGSKVEVLEAAAQDQRNILSKYIEKPIEEIPQIFVPYKEVLEIYEQGMELPEDITIVWPDDNYGYLKKLSNSEERHRSGGAGVYYHISYLGWPNDYLWLNTTPPSLMYSELERAYSLGADKYWLLNVGDIKPGEMGMQLFLDMAWSFSDFSFENIADYQAKKLASIFGESYQEDLAYIFDRYYFHGFARKPEYMTGDYRWNSLYEKEEVKDTGFSFANYREAETRLAEYKAISDSAGRIMEQIPDSHKASFFQLVYYPVKAAQLYNTQMLTAQKNRWYAVQGRVSANALVSEVKDLHDQLADLTERYNSLLDGKWKGMMTAPGFLPEPQLPTTQTVASSRGQQAMGIFVEQGGVNPTANLQLPEFSAFNQGDSFFEVFSKVDSEVSWEATFTKPWIQLSQSSGKTATQDRVYVSIDWKEIPEEEELAGEIKISGGGQERRIGLSVVNPAMHSLTDLADSYVEDNGVVSISPARFHRKVENGEIAFQPIEGLGYSNTALRLGSSMYDDGRESYVEYDFYIATPGEAAVHIYMLPLFAKDKSHSTRYGIQVDDGEVEIRHNDEKEYSQEWADNVMRNTAINTINVELATEGKHTLRLYCVDPGMIAQKIVIDLGGLKPSYLGPPTTLAAQQN